MNIRRQPINRLARTMECLLEAAEGHRQDCTRAHPFLLAADAVLPASLRPCLGNSLRVEKKNQGTAPEGEEETNRPAPRGVVELWE